MAASGDLEVVIRAPTGNEVDFKLSCRADWTVKTLKDHLALEYPSKPPCHAQRIIYQGKLLSDHQRIVAVLKPVRGAAAENVSVFFLVCSSPSSAPTSPVPATSPELARGTSLPVKESLQAAAQNNSRREVSTPVAPVTPATPAISSPSGTSGLRHRSAAASAASSSSSSSNVLSGAQANQATSRQTTPAQQQPVTSTPVAAAAAPASAGGIYTSAYWPYSGWNPAASPTMSGNDPSNQQAYLSAMYQQYNPYINQRMWQAYTASAAAAAAAHASQAYAVSPNWYAPGLGQGVPAVPVAGVVPNVTPAMPAAPAPAAPPAAAPVGAGGADVAAPVHAAAPVADQAPAMPAAGNVGGMLGGVNEDDDDEGNGNGPARGGRWWIARAFLGIFRTLIMLSMLYSFLSPLKFAVLVVVIAVFNLYQAGFFGLQRAQHRRVRAEDINVRALAEEVRRLQRARQRRDMGGEDAARHREGQENENNEVDGDSSSSPDSDSSDSEESSNHPSAARRQPLPSGGRVAFAAVKAFFTSLYREPEEFAHRG